MNKSCLKYRLYPTKAQERALNDALETCRLVYNSLVLDRKYQHETAGVSVGYYTQKAYLPVWKQTHPELSHVYSQVLQDVSHRVHLAFDAFFRRVRDGENPGFPRFKGEGRYDSITYTQGKSYRVGQSVIDLPKIGRVRAKIHRQPWGEVKTCTVRRQNGKWFACVVQEVEPARLPPSGEAVGIDVGLKTFAALSDGTFIENPRFFRRDEAALARAQRKVERLKGDPAARRPTKRVTRQGRNRGRARKVASALARARKAVARIHERVRNRRHDFCHQNARRIVNRFGLIAVERLNVNGMGRRPEPKEDPDNPGGFLPNGAGAKAGLNKSIADAAWSQFRQVLTSKAESAGRVVTAVNPAYTSQDCSACGYRPDGREGRTKKKLSDRWHWCPMCGLSVDRDTNAAVNILTLGQQSVACEKA